MIKTKTKKILLVCALALLAAALLFLGYRKGVELYNTKNAEELVAAVDGKISFWVRQNEELIGGLQLRIGDTIYDYTISN